MAIFQYMIICLLILQDASAATMASKNRKTTVRQQCLFALQNYKAKALENIIPLVSDLYLATFRDIPKVYVMACRSGWIRIMFLEGNITKQPTDLEGDKVTELFQDIVFEHQKNTLKQFTTYSFRSLDLNDPQQITKDFYTAGITCDVEGTRIVVYNPDVETKKKSAVCIPKFPNPRSVHKRLLYSKIPLNFAISKLFFLRIQSMWKEQCWQERQEEWRKKKQILDDCLQSSDGLVLDDSDKAASSRKSVSSTMLFARLRDVIGAHALIWPTQRGKASVGSIRISYKQGGAEPDLDFPFAAAQAPAEVVSTHLKGIQWSNSKHQSYSYFDYLAAGEPNYASNGSPVPTE